MCGLAQRRGKWLLAAAVAVAGLALLAGTDEGSAASFNPDPAFPIGPISATADHQVPEFDRVASALAGRHAIVNCWSIKGWQLFREWQATHHDRRAIDSTGFTYFETHRIQLPPFVCHALAQTMAHPALQPLISAWAITVLAHESAHASGIEVENRAECRAMATEPRAAKLLGVPHSLAVEFQHLYRGSVYPYDSPQYRLRTCQAGKPGVLAPDTYGTPPRVRPLARLAKALVRYLPPWKDAGGASFIGGTNPCTIVTSFAQEQASYKYLLVGPHRFAVRYSSEILTKRAFAAVRARIAKAPRCELKFGRSQIHDFHYKETITDGRLPASVMKLSPLAYRQVLRYPGQAWDFDFIVFVEPAQRMIVDFQFLTRANRVDPQMEERAAEGARAVLQAESSAG